METTIIRDIIQFCVEKNFFSAETVFLAKHKEGEKFNVIFIYSAHPEPVDMANPPQLPFNVTRFSIHDCYTNLLFRDNRFAEVFLNVIILKDSLGISSTILKAITPISEYNRNISNIQSLSSKTKIRILFYDINEVGAFVKNVIVPISKSLGASAKLSTFYFQFEHCFLDNSLNCTITYLVPESVRSATLLHMQKYVVANLSELFLNKVLIPYNGTSDELEYVLAKDYYPYIEKVLGVISEEILLHANQEELTDNQCVTHAIYYSLQFGKIFFNDCLSFAEYTERIWKESLHLFVSPTSRSFLDCDLSEHVKTKIVEEYRSLHKKVLPTLILNFDDMIKNWVNIDTSDQFSGSTISLKENIASLQTDPLYQSVIKSVLASIFKCFGLNNYYKGFVLFTLQKLRDYNEI